MGRFPRAMLAALAGVILFVVTACGGVTETTLNTWGVGTATNINVYAVARVGNLMVIGGNFTEVTSPDGKTTHAAGGLAALNASTGAWVWSADTGGTVYEIVAHNSTLWIGGSFGVKKYTSSGVVQSFSQPYSVGAVRGIAIAPNRVYYGGDTGVAASDATGTGVWLDPTDRIVYTVAYAQNNGQPRILAGGNFCKVGGVYRPALASLGTNGAIDTSFNAKNFGCGTIQDARDVLDMVISGQVAYVAGGGSLNLVAAVNTVTGGTIWATKHGDGDVQAVTLQDGYLYAGGHFDCVDGSDINHCRVKRQKVEKLTTSGELTDWTPDLRGGFLGVWSMAGDAKGLYVGGNFTTVNGLQRHKVAIFH